MEFLSNGKQSTMLNIHEFFSIFHTGLVIKPYQLKKYLGSIQTPSLIILGYFQTPLRSITDQLKPAFVTKISLIFSGLKRNIVCDTWRKIYSIFHLNIWLFLTILNSFASWVRVYSMFIKTSFLMQFSFVTFVDLDLVFLLLFPFLVFANFWFILFNKVFYASSRII